MRKLNKFIGFMLSGLTAFSLATVVNQNVAKAEAAAGTKVYEKITSDQDDWSGVYLLCSEYNGITYSFKGNPNDSRLKITDPVGGVIAKRNQGAVELIIEKYETGYSIKIEPISCLTDKYDNKYIYNNRNNDILYTSDEPQVNYISYSQEEGVLIKSYYGSEENEYTTMKLAYGNSFNYCRDTHPAAYRVDLYKTNTIDFNFTRKSVVGLVGEQEQLTYTTQNFNGVPDVSYSSSNTNILTVDNDGLVTMKKTGLAHVTGTFNNASIQDVADITVLPSNNGPIFKAGMLETKPLTIVTSFKYTTIGTYVRKEGNTRFILDVEGEEVICKKNSAGEELPFKAGDLVQINGKFQFENGIIAFLEENTYNLYESQGNALVTFNVNGGSAVESVNTYKGEKLCVPNYPTKTNYDFGGWYKDEELTQAWDFKNDTVESDITLYAKWNDIKDVVVADFTSKSLTASLGFSYFESESNGVCDTFTANDLNLEETLKTTETSNNFGYVVCNGKKDLNDSIVLQFSDYNAIYTKNLIGKKLKGIEISWDEEIQSKMTLNVYGKNEIYTSHFTFERGELIGTLSSKENTTYIDINAEYLNCMIMPALDTTAYIKDIKFYYFDSYSYSDITDLSLLFKMDYDFTRWSSIEASGIYVTANTEFTYDNSNPVTALPGEKKLDLINETIKNEFIGGVRINDLSSQYSLKVLAVGYIVIDGEYYFSKPNIKSVKDMCDTYTNGSFDELIENLANAIKTQATANA